MRFLNFLGTLLCVIVGGRGSNCKFLGKNSSNSFNYYKRMSQKQSLPHFKKYWSLSPWCILFETPPPLKLGKKRALSLAYRSRRPEVFFKKSVLRNYVKFTGKHLCQSLFFNKVTGLRLLTKRPWHRRFPFNFAKFLRTPTVAVSAHDHFDNKISQMNLSGFNIFWSNKRV